MQAKQDYKFLLKMMTKVPQWSNWIHLYHLFVN